MVPRTLWGRLFCILFALVGIPLTLSVIADMGVLMASALAITHKRIMHHFPKKVFLNYFFLYSFLKKLKSLIVI